MRASLAAVALALLVSGCTGGSPAPGTTPGPDDEAGAAATIGAPEWSLGDWWTWSSPQIDGPYTSVVAADHGSDWLMATDHPDIAWFDARSDIASLGAVRKSDLAGSQGSTRVEFFRFPMTADLAWTTTWDGVPMDIRVLAVQNGVATLDATRADGSLYATYTYRASHGYFGHIQYYDETGTTIGFESEVTGAGADFSGQLVRWSYDVALEMAGPIAGAAFAETLPVPLTVTDVYADLFVDCTSGLFIAGVAPLPVVTAAAGLDDRGYGTTDGVCPMQIGFSGSVGAPRETVPGSTEEQWGFSGFGDPAASGVYTFNVFVRTLETVQVE
jgi:hypothetical protein